MGMNGDWITIDGGQYVETRQEPVTNEEGVVVSYNNSYRTILTEVKMETFSDVSSFTYSTGVPETDVETIISDQYRTTQKETKSGEHTVTYQTVSGWAAY